MLLELAGGTLSLVPRAGVTRMCYVQRVGDGIGFREFSKVPTG
jgi:hypothetical protein